MEKFKTPKSWHLLVIDYQENTYALFGPYSPMSDKAEGKVIDAVNLANKNGRKIQQQIVYPEQLNKDVLSFVQEKGLREVPRTGMLSFDPFE